MMSSQETTLLPTFLFMRLSCFRHAATRHARTIAQGLSSYLQLLSNAEGDRSRQSSSCVVSDGLGTCLRFVFAFAKPEGMNGHGNNKGRELNP